MIFKIVHANEWHAVELTGVYQGSAKDQADGFLHFSTEEQLQGTLARYYADADGLVLVAVEEDALGNSLKYETSTGGTLFPHLYGTLSLNAVKWSRPITRDAKGVFLVPT